MKFHNNLSVACCFRDVGSPQEKKIEVDQVQFAEYLLLVDLDY